MDIFKDGSHLLLSTMKASFDESIKARLKRWEEEKWRIKRGIVSKQRIEVAERVGEKTSSGTGKNVRPANGGAQPDNIGGTTCSAKSSGAASGTGKNACPTYMSRGAKAQRETDKNVCPAALKITRRHLPHHTFEGSTYFITCRVKPGAL